MDDIATISRYVKHLPHYIYAFELRMISSSFIFECRALWWIRKSAAAPSLPCIFPPVLSSTFKMWRRSISSNATSSVSSGGAGLPVKSSGIRRCDPELRITPRSMTFQAPTHSQAMGISPVFPSWIWKSYSKVLPSVSQIAVHGFWVQIDRH